MKSAHIRVLVILAIITLIGIVSTQLYWLNRAIEQQDQVFNHNVHVALRNVVESLCEANGKDYPATDPIEQVTNSYYIVRTNDQIDLASLEYLISAEISERAITEDFEYGVYDCQNDKMVFAENVNLESDEPKGNLPSLENEEYYFGVYFPNKSQSLIAGLDLWKFTTGLTLVVIVFFGYALFVILRQKRLSEVQKDFINNVTHELKTPLATLSLASNTLSEKVGDSGGKYLQIIQSEVSRLKSNVDDILEASLSESKSNIQSHSVQLSNLLESLIEECGRQYASEMIEWDFEGEEGIVIESNKSIIEKVVRNLIDNAIKYGGKKIGIKLDQDQKNTVISICDNGPGIPKEHQGRVFNKFYRVPEEKDRHNVKGFGLGLHIVKSSVNKLKGRIELHSEQGKGCTFKITLPNG
ncbi:MAG: HAMP domain-containing sensor histidine kinase [Bacteroidota bacterium]